MKNVRIKLKNACTLRSTSVATVVACFALSMMLFSGCGPATPNKPDKTDDPDNPDNPDHPETIVEKASVKYADFETNTVNFITFDNGGKRVRYDEFTFGESGELDKHSLSIVNHINKTVYLFDSHDWLDISYDDAIKNPNSYMLYPANIADESKFSKVIPVEDVTIAGKTCKMGWIRDQETMFQSAIWNGLTMSKLENGYEKLRALAVTLDVPASAFTKTADVSWINGSDYGNNGMGIGMFICGGERYAINRCGSSFSTVDLGSFQVAWMGFSGPGSSGKMDINFGICFVKENKIPVGIFEYGGAPGGLGEPKTDFFQFTFNYDNEFNGEAYNYYEPGGENSGTLTIEGSNPYTVTLSFKMISYGETSEPKGTAKITYQGSISGFNKLM